MSTLKNLLFAHCIFAFFSRQIKDVKSKAVQNRQVFTNFLCLPILMFFFFREIVVVYIKNK